MLQASVSMSIKWGQYNACSGQSSQTWTTLYVLKVPNLSCIYSYSYVLATKSTIYLRELKAKSQYAKNMVDSFNSQGEKFIFAEKIRLIVY